MQNNISKPENFHDESFQETASSGILPCSAVFLDRDGVINNDSEDYIKSWPEFKFIPGSIEAIRLLTVNGLNPIIITNQSLINRNMISINALNRIHDMMKKKIENKGGRIKDIFFCPHSPEDNCECRKPKPGLIHQAESKYNLRLESAVMIGDSAKDIECAKNAGCNSVLVKTGNGKNAMAELKNKHLHPGHIANNLYEAVLWLLSRKGADCLIS
jgi:D-glycero-D-manno-heptose 1,7-bisphosphate phosphatase